MRNTFKYAWMLGLLALAATSPSLADEPVLLAQESSGILELDGENRLSVTGSDLTLSVRVGREGELRFAARARTNRREERPVALWLDGRTLRIDRVGVTDPSAAQEPLVIEVAISPGVRVEADLTDAVFSVNSVQADITLEGRNVEATLIAPVGSVTADLVSSSFNAKNIRGDLDLTCESVEGKVERVDGFTTASLAASSMNFGELIGGSELELENSAVDLVDLQGEVRVVATGGSVGLRSAANGAELELDETALAVTQTEGDVTIDTNHEVRFTDIRGNLRVTGFGGRVLGNGVAGTLTISTNSAEIAVENLAGTSQIDGSDLAISAKTVRGDMNLVVTSSTVVVEDAAAALTVQSEFGDVNVMRATGEVKINSRDGDVLVAGHRGPLEIHSDGPLVDVRWLQLPREKDAVIENESGDVNLFFPRTAQCRIEAQSSFGRIESSVETVRVLDDERRASGVIGRSNRPLVKVKAGNNISIAAGNPPEGGGRRPRGADGQ
jgi:hypothetical protein